MSWLNRLRQLAPSWPLENVALGGLLLIITIAGLVGLGINAQVRQITNHALESDIELEDRSDDFRVAVLDMRHYHRNITFVGPTRGGLADFEAAYARLHTQINRLEELDRGDAPVSSAQELRDIANGYYEGFRPAIDLYESDRQAFTLASDRGLVEIARLEGAAQEIDHLGEQRSAAALRRLEVAENNARVVLLTVLAGLVLTGVALAYIIARNTREKQLIAARLAQALQSKNDFIADASHELRTPLTVLRANAEVGLSLERNCVHTELLEEIVRESERMTRLVEDLLFLARSDSDSVPLEPEPIPIEPFLAELAERANILARQYDTAFRRQLNARGYAILDRVRIEQVVLILVDNAAKYSAPGVPVTLRSGTENGYLVIEVIDRGPGIPPADLERIFERFYRVDKARSRKQGGTGLGLSIAKSIVEGHGGRIEAESRLEQGTTMRFYLPLDGRRE